MSTKRKQELDKLDEYYTNLKEEDLREDVKFEIDKDAFKGPFTCHGKKTVLISKKISYGNIEFKYNVWQCKACKKDYVDSEQAKRYEKFLIMKRLSEEDPITIERKMNYDGKTYFFRFPKELTNNLSKTDIVDIKLLTPNGRMFLVEIKSR